MKKIYKIIKYAILGIAALLLLAVTTVIGAGYVLPLPDTEQTPAGYSRNVSQYVTMHDGVKIAIDVWFPKDMEADKQYPTALQMTRYWRASELTGIFRGLMALGVVGTGNMVDETFDWFNTAGYVVIKVDARGSGASFGTRTVEWAREEVQDYGEILEWIAKQPWSNGKVGSFGVSYEGNTAEMIAVNNRPELKVVAPLYGDFNPFLGLIQPGGAKNTYVDAWGAMVRAMDLNDICTIADAEGFSCFLTKMMMAGVKPVDGHEDLLELAVADHKANRLVVDNDRTVVYIDDELDDTGYMTKDMSPFGHQEQIEASGVPMLLHLGWHDAATTEGALNRFIKFSNDQHLLIGPFTHGGGMDTDPFNDVDTPVSPSSKEQYQSLIEYFDMFLKGNETGLKPAKKITYYTNGAGTWSTTEVWPPVGFDTKTYFLGDGQQLTEKLASVTQGTDSYTVDFSVTNGSSTRWHTNMGGGDVVYADRATQDEKLLHYTSAPLESTIEITGTPTISLHVASSHKDALFIAYLEDIAPDGTVTYITEGVLRADNRKIVDPGTLSYPPLGIEHSYLRDDAEPMVPGEVTEVAFNFFPISVQIQAGHKLRVALAGADEVMFRRWPEEGTPEWIIHKGGLAASSITIPFKVVN